MWYILTENIVDLQIYRKMLYFILAKTKRLKKNHNSHLIPRGGPVGESAQPAQIYHGVYSPKSPKISI